MASDIPIEPKTSPETPRSRRRVVEAAHHSAERAIDILASTLEVEPTADTLPELPSIGADGFVAGFQCRPFNPGLPGEEGYVFTSWMHSWRNNYAPWPALKEWDTLPQQRKDEFFQHVKTAGFSHSRVNRNHRALWLQSQGATIHYWMEHGRIVVVHPKGEPNVLVGFAAYPAHQPELRGSIETDTRPVSLHRGRDAAPVGPHGNLGDGEAPHRAVCPLYLYVQPQLRGLGIGSALAGESLRGLAERAAERKERR